jgi:hypothetical protein
MHIVEESLPSLRYPRYCFDQYFVGISAKAAPIPNPLIPRQVVFADQDKLRRAVES